MMNLEELVDKEIENGYGDVNARAKVCQDIVLKAISNLITRSQASWISVFTTALQ